ncbi:MAG: hypothetical protein HY302_01565 [Opitutae bacterium]|nr:hypothetical protein [Opitutae bacterium]
MTNQTKIKSLLLTAAVSLGLTAGAFAQNTGTQVPNPASAELSGGQLGAAYAGLSLDYTKLQDGPPSAARGFTFTVNQPLNTGFDAKFSFDYAKASAFGVNANQKDLFGSLVAFTSNSWGRSYVEAGAGWSWFKAGSFSEDSFAFLVGTGVEFQAAPALTVTPYLNFVRQTGFNSNEYDLGVKASYRITKEWDLTAKVQHNFVRRDTDATLFSLGANYRY